MYFFNTIQVGFKEIWSHKFRSFLTMLGIILGVASLVAMAGMVKGMENGMKEAMIAMGGADKVLTEEQPVPPYQEALSDEAPGRTMQDVIALRESAPLIRMISPEMALSEDDRTISYGGKSVRPSECVGVWPAALGMNLHTLQYGRFFNALDEEYARPVCVIGTGIRDDLFGSPEEIGKEIVPLGEVIQIDGRPFTVVGMFTRYESESDRNARLWAKNHPDAAQKKSGPARRGWGRKGGWAFWRKNYTVYMPLNSMWLRFRSSTGTNNIPDPRLTDIDLKVADLEHLEPALQQARNVLLMMHHGVEDFSFRTQENQIESINTQIRNARLSGGIIAGISLLVGGIGIMNIMFASINERIREIGICKAVGATGAAVFIQILVESMVIALLGALVGVLASYGLIQLLILVAPTQNAPVILPHAMALATLFSMAVGVAAGLFPAIKAAKLDPIQALRYE